jgi:protein gp37
VNKTPIEWTDYSVNPLKMRMPDGTLINVCVHKSDGCRFCYAEGIVKRWWKKEWGPFPGYTVALLKLGTPVLVKEQLEAVIRLSNRIAEGKADPTENKVFWNDMTDEYLDFWPDEFLDQIWAVRALTQNLIHQVLTKRTDRMLAYFTGRNCDWDCLREAIEFNHLLYSKKGGEMMPQITAAGWLWETYTDGEGFKDVHLEYHGALPLPNVIVMTSVEDQSNADERIPQLLNIPAAFRGLSIEPLLSAVDLRFAERNCDLTNDSHECETVADKIHWVVCGGESGPKARPMHPDFVRSIRDQCVTAGVPFFFKQWGEYRPALSVAEATNYPILVAGPESKSNPASSCYHLDHQVAAYLDGTKLSQAQCAVVRLGKKAAGRVLDGREWNEFPPVISSLESGMTTKAAA